MKVIFKGLGSIKREWTEELKFDPEVYMVVAEEVLKAEIEKLKSEAQRQWPVREIGSLYSRDKWRMNITRVSKTRVMATLENYAPYAGAIYQSYGSVAEKLLINPADQAQGKLAEKINEKTARKGE